MSGDSEQQPDCASRDAVHRGRTAFARRAWREAHRELAAADRAAGLEAEDLERLAWSSELTERIADRLPAQAR